MVKFKALKSAKVTEKVTENSREVLEILMENPYATYEEIAGRLNVSRKTISQKIKLLKESGSIIRVGSAKKGYWKVEQRP